MEAITGSENSQLFVHLAHSYGALVISLIERVRHECPMLQESFRRALMPLHRALGSYLGQPPFEDYRNSLSQSFNIRDALHSYHTLPSIPHHREFHPSISGQQIFNRGMEEDTVHVPSMSPIMEPIGFTSTPFRAPVTCPRPERFALIIQMLTTMLTTENSALDNINQFADDPIFRERLLAELDELRTLVKDNTATEGRLEN